MTFSDTNRKPRAGLKARPLLHPRYGGIVPKGTYATIASVADERSAIPLADVLSAANELVSAGLIKDYALGGALAAIYYTEPITTYDADIFFVISDKTLSVGIPAIYAHLQSEAGALNANISSLRTFQFNSSLPLV